MVLVLILGLVSFGLGLGLVMFGLGLGLGPVTCGLGVAISGLVNITEAGNVHKITRAHNRIIRY